MEDGIWNIKEVYKDTLNHIKEKPVGLQIYIFAYDLDSWKQEYVYQRCYFLVQKDETDSERL